MKIDEWNKTIRIMLEEDSYYDKDGFRFIDGRQKEIFTIPRKLVNVEWVMSVVNYINKK